MPRKHAKTKNATKATKAKAPAPTPPWTLLATIALVLLACIAYAPVTGCEWIWDDDAYVTGNTTLRSAEGLGRIWFELRATPQYYPMVFTTYWLEYRLWGDSPAGFHVVNVLLHAVSALLLWRILVRLAVPGAWVAAAVFAVHPIGVESVAWVTERKNVLSCALYLGAALSYLSFALPARADDDAPPPWRLYALSLVLFVLALLSKTVTCSLPAALLLVLWWKRSRLTRADLLPLAPFFAVGLALAGITVWMERTFVGASGSGWSLSGIDRVLVAGRAAWFYAAKLVVPVDLAFIYPRWDIDSGVWWQYLFPVTAVAGVAVLWTLRHRIGRGPLVAILIFGGTLVPALGFFDVYPFRFSFVADHFQYHASIAFMVLGVATVATLLARLGTARRNVSIGLTVVTLVVLGTLTFRQTAAYENSETLWRDTLVKNPEAWIAHNILGSIEGQRGNHRAAIEHFESAIAINPDIIEARVNLAQGLSMFRRSSEAAEHLRYALKILPDKPEMLMNTAWMLATHPDPMLRDPAEAVRLGERTVELTRRRNPRHLDVLAAAYASAARFDEAIATATEARDLAVEQDKDRLAMSAEKRRMLYQRRSPFRQGMRLP